MPLNSLEYCVCTAPTTSAPAGIWATARSNEPLGLAYNNLYWGHFTSILQGICSDVTKSVDNKPQRPLFYCVDYWRVHSLPSPICQQQTSASAIWECCLLTGALATKSHMLTTSLCVHPPYAVPIPGWLVDPSDGCIRHQIICVGAVYRCMSMLKQGVYCLQ